MNRESHWKNHCFTIHKPSSPFHFHRFHAIRKDLGVLVGVTEGLSFIHSFIHSFVHSFAHSLSTSFHFTARHLTSLPFTSPPFPSLHFTSLSPFITSTNLPNLCESCEICGNQWGIEFVNREHDFVNRVKSVEMHGEESL